MSFDGNNFDLPFESQAETPMELDGVQYSGGVVILAALTPEIPGHGRQPVLIYRFAKPDGSGFYPPIALVVEDTGRLKNLTKLTSAAVRAAVAAATEAAG